MASHKYLDDCGFTVFEFGIHNNGTIDVSNGDGVDVVTGVTKEQQEQISNYISDLELRVQAYIERHYWNKQ